LAGNAAAGPLRRLVASAPGVGTTCGRKNGAIWAAQAGVERD